MNFEEFNDIFVRIDDFKLDKDFILSSHNNHEYNNIIVDYYKRLIEEEGSSELKKYGSIIPISKTHQLENCNKFWLIDRYDRNLVKDFVGTSLCKDKFCNNCKKVKQAVRMSRYIPCLKPYSDNLYHIIFTVPNVCGADLKFTISKMSSCFRKLMRLFQGNLVRFIDFKKYGYEGAIRSLEITFNKDSYHPHYHCAFVLKNLDLTKDKKNKFSYSNRSTDIRMFSDFEIMLQKLWYMLYNNITLTKKNYDELDTCYSVACNKFGEDDYAELFKYITKATDETDNILTYDNFKSLYFATYRLKQIQGYGCFYNITDSDITLEEINEVYSDIKLFLSSDEVPKQISEKPFDLLNDENYLIISRKKIYQYLKEKKSSNID